MTEILWTLEQYPAAIVDGIRGHKLPTEEPPAVLVRCDGRATRPLDDDDWRELAGVWQAAGLPLEPLAEGVGLFRAFDYVEAFNARPGYAGWQVGAVPGRDAYHVERVSARIEQDEVREELREAIQSGSVTPRRPRSMTRAKPHEVGFRPGLVLTAADLEAAGLGVPAEVAPTPAPSASASAVAAPAPVVAPAEAVPVLGAGEVETPAERATRRLREFLALGGKAPVSGGVAVLGGTQGALQKLADRERAAGRKRSDRSDIGKELKAEALRQRVSPA